MRVIIQRVSSASVTINSNIKSKISLGYLILLGIEELDTNDDIDWLCNKITNLRIFNDENGKMNLSIKDINGDILLISQFTLYANILKGNRPSFTQAAHPKIAKDIYTKFIAKLEELLGKSIGLGEFGADMKVELINDGPVTINIDSKLR